MEKSNIIHDNEMNDSESDFGMITGKSEQVAFSVTSSVRRRSAVEEVKVTVRNMDIRMTNLDSRVLATSTRVDEHSHQIGGLQNRVGGLSQQFDGLQDRFRDHPQQIEELKHEFEDRSQQINRLERRFEQEIGGLQRRLEDFSQQIRDLQNGLEDPSHQIGGLRESFQHQIRDLQNGLEECSRQIGGLRESFEQQITDLQNELEESVQGLSQEIRNLNENVAENERQNTERFRNMESQIKSLGIFGNLASGNPSTAIVSAQNSNQTPSWNPLQYLNPNELEQTAEQLRTIIGSIQQEYKDNFNLNYTIGSIEICCSNYPEPKYLVSLLNKLWNGLRPLNFLDKIMSLTVPGVIQIPWPNQHFPNLSSELEHFTKLKRLEITIAAFNPGDFQGFTSKLNRELESLTIKFGPVYDANLEKKREDVCQAIGNLSGRHLPSLKVLCLDLNGVGCDSVLESFVSNIQNFASTISTIHWGSPNVSPLCLTRILPTLKSAIAVFPNFLSLTIEVARRALDFKYEEVLAVKESMKENDKIRFMGQWIALLQN